MNKFFKTVEPIGQAKKQEKVASCHFSDQLSNSLQFVPKNKPLRYYTRNDVDSKENLESRQKRRLCGNKISPGAIKFAKSILKRQEHFDKETKYQNDNCSIFINNGQHYVEAPLEDEAKSFKTSTATMGRWSAELRNNGVVKTLRKYRGRGKQTLMYRVEGLEEWLGARAIQRREEKLEKKAKAKEQHKKRMEKQRQRRAAAKEKQKEAASQEKSPWKARNETSFIRNVTEKIKNFSCSTINKEIEEQEPQKVPWNITKDGKLTLSSNAIDFFKRIREIQDRELYMQQLIDEGRIPTKYTQKGTEWLFECPLKYLPLTIQLKLWAKAFGRNLEGYYWAQTTRKAKKKALVDRFLKTVLCGLGRIILCCHSTIEKWLNDGECPLPFEIGVTIDEQIRRLSKGRRMADFPEHTLKFFLQKFLDMTGLSRVEKSKVLTAFNAKYGSRKGIYLTDAQ